LSITLAPSNTPTIEEIDAEIDAFNDAMNALGYDATVRFTRRWGEVVIEVTADGETIEEFWSSVPSFLDDFRDYSHKTQDATSIARAEMNGVAA
jgi:hypothetical protein